ncbi:MAG: phosphoenolpyruvate--protein phosphotransferase [Francisellaceae bacterium]
MVWQALAKIIDQALDLDTMLTMFVSEAKEKLMVDACSIFLLDEDNTYMLCASTLLPSVRSGMIYINAGEDLIGQVAQREESIKVDDLYQSSRYCVLQTFSRQRFYALLAAPIIHKSEVIAILVFQRLKPGSIDESLQNDVMTLCANISKPLNRAIDVDDVIEQIEERNYNTLFFDGEGVSEGVSKGQALVRYSLNDIDSIPDKQTQVDNEEEAFKEAVKEVKKHLNEMLDRVTQLASQTEALLFESYLQMLDSSRFYDAIIEQIRSGIWVQTAIKNVVNEQSAIYKDMDDHYLRERASDIKDLGRRIILALDDKLLTKSNYPSSTVLIASEVTASMIAEVPKGRLKAVVSEKGSAYSHAAIIAKALSIPFITAINALPINYIEGKEIIVDAYIGRVYAQPNPGLRAAYDRIILHESEKAHELQSIKLLPSQTKDGFKMTLKANVGLIADLDRAASQGAMNIGLYRSEIPFMIRDRFPSEEEQRIIYQQVLSTFPGQPTVLRTLDVGADKTLPYFYEAEQNPALGWRGIRMMLDQSDLFLTQIRAMLKASEAYENLHVLLPMITTIEEVKEAKKLIRQAYRELVEEGYSLALPAIGIMIEVPSVLVLLDSILPLVDFISIGSNDMTQYMLAVDRTNSKVSALYNQLHPAMIRVFYHIVKMAHKYQKEVSICGEIAGNPMATPILIGMGFDALSMNAVSILKVKYVLRSVTRKKCRNVLKQVLKLSTVDEVYTYLENFLVENDLGGLIRAGRQV